MHELAKTKTKGDKIEEEKNVRLLLSPLNEISLLWPFDFNRRIHLNAHQAVNGENMELKQILSIKICEKCLTINQ